MRRRAWWRIRPRYHCPHEFLCHPVRSADRAGTPAGPNNPIHAGLRAWARAVSRNFDAGKAHHGWVAWSLAVVLPALVTLASMGL
jgi:hypothetical protein